MMFDDDDDMPLPDQFLSQLDLIESQAMANMEVPCSKKNDNFVENAPVFAEVDNLKNTIEDYKRQIERLQDHEMSLQGEATMLRQRLDAKQKEADSTRLEMHKAIDQLNQNQKRKLDDLEQQLRSLKSQLQFADHELQQTRSSRVSLDNTMVSSSQRQPQSGIKQGAIVQFFPMAEKNNQTAGPNKPFSTFRSSPIPDDTITVASKPEPSAPKALEDTSDALLQQKAAQPLSERKWFLPNEGGRSLSQMCGQRHTFGICCGGTKTASASCPVSKRTFVCDLLSPTTAKSLIRVLEHARLMINTGSTKANEICCDGAIDSFVSLLDLVSMFLSLNDQANCAQDPFNEHRLLSIAVLLEHLCTLFEDADFVKYLLCSSSLQCAGLRLVSSMFLKVPRNRNVLSSIESADELATRLKQIWRRVFERVLPSLFANSALEQASAASTINRAIQVSPPTFDSTTPKLNIVFETALVALTVASSNFSVIDLRSYLTDCPLLTVASAFQNWFHGFLFPLNARISSAHRGTYFTFIRLITQSVTLSSTAMERFFNHPCECQPIVIGILAHIGLAAIKSDQQKSCEHAKEANNAVDILNVPILDAVLNVLLLIQSQQPLKSTNHQPVFHLFLAKLAEFLCHSVGNTPQRRLRDSTLSAIRQLLRLHDVLSS